MESMAFEVEKEEYRICLWVGICCFFASIPVVCTFTIDVIHGLVQKFEA